MDILELENRVAKIRDKPLLLVCLTQKGETCVMTARQCYESDSRYVHIVADELDELLGAALGGDNERV